MQRNFASSKNRDLARAVLLAMGAVTTVGAQAATLIGGGATLPAVGYVGGPAALGSGSNARLTNPVSDTDSLFGAFASATSNTVTYCQTGSGTGKRVLGGVTGYAASNACGDFTTTPLGFGVGSVAAPDFAASDAPMSASEYNAVISAYGATRTAPVQFPSVAGAVAIIYNNAALASLNLTTTQVCQIFTGQISNWSSFGGGNHPITVVYRSDGSGTTFSLSNHLAATCGGLSTGHYTTDQTFTNVVATAAGLPSGSSGQSGNPGVVNFVAANSFTIGYGEVADAVARGAGQIATVNGLDPINDFATTGTFTVTTTTGKDIATTVSSTGRPVLENLPGTPPQPGCVVIVDPASYAAPSSGYPIVAVSNLLGYYGANGTHKTAVQGLLASPYTTRVADIDAGTGLAYLSDTSGNLTSAKVTGCVN
ncbi:MAG: hypothetical protein JWR07_1503 [Nevskia sp.]|nr:hypothetical protein [Nevskia sp.]